LTRNPEDEGGTFFETSEETQPYGAVTLKTSFFNNQTVETRNHCFRVVKNMSISDYFIFCIYCVSLTYELFSVKNEMI